MQRHGLSITQNFDKINADEYMQKLRESIHKNELEMDGYGRIKSCTDYMKENGNLPKSNVLKIIFKNGDKLIVRPSGTEPKIKLYQERYRMTPREYRAKKLS